MDVREKLVELVKNALRAYGNDLEKVVEPYEFIADFLIHSGVTVQEWISVKERLPEDASTVLAIDIDGTISSAYYVGRWHSGGDLDEDAVTYWMPLPTAPKEDK